MSNSPTEPIAVEDLNYSEDNSGKFESVSSVFGALGSFVFESIEAIVIALALCVVLYLFLITPHEVVGQSMYPNFRDGEYLIANKLVYRFSDPNRGDVIIFKHSASQDYIKRVIALPGETIALRDGSFYINGEILDESEYLASTVITNGGNALKEGEELVIPNGQYFAAGDNRPKSSDSRVFGPINKEDIKGRAWIVYFPFNQFRIIKTPEYPNN
jgi:signal peptidase I